MMLFRKFFPKANLSVWFAVFFCALVLMAACAGKPAVERHGTGVSRPPLPSVDTHFSGDYTADFNDSALVHTEAGRAKGIVPMITRADTSDYLGTQAQLVKIPAEMQLFKVDELYYSVPYLVPDAARLLTDISENFRDSLVSKNMPPYRVLVTSVTRTEEDLAKLLRRNRNASPESAHQYGTTFDISWRRFDKVVVGNASKREVPTDKLKYVLAQVLYDLRVRERCFVKHERRQACFHITVR